MTDRPILFSAPINLEVEVLAARQSMLILFIHQVFVPCIISSLLCPKQDWLNVPIPNIFLLRTKFTNFFTVHNNDSDPLRSLVKIIDYLFDLLFKAYFVRIIHEAAPDALKESLVSIYLTATTFIDLSTDNPKANVCNIDQMEGANG